MDGCFFPISEVASRRVEVRSGVVNGPELLRSDFRILTQSRPSYLAVIDVNNSNSYSLPNSARVRMTNGMNSLPPPWPASSRICSLLVVHRL